MRIEDIHLAKASGVGNKVVLLGAKTGGDGIGGVSVLASETFDADGPAKRPAVQVGDPFAEKVLIECCLDLYAAHVGEVTGGKKLEVFWGDKLIIDVPPRSVAHDGPLYDRPMQRPAYLDALQASVPDHLARPGDGEGLRAALLALVASPNLCDKSWITGQYDRYVM